MKVDVVEATSVDLREILSRSDSFKIKDADRTLQYCYTMSLYCWAGMVDNKAACIWGLIPPTLMSDQAYLWMVATDLVAKHRFIFVRHSQRVMEQMLERYPTIVGHCQIGAEESKRWLRWLGAKFGQPQGKMLPFVIRKK